MSAARRPPRPRLRSSATGRPKLAASPPEIGDDGCSWQFRRPRARFLIRRKDELPRSIGPLSFKDLSRIIDQHGAQLLVGYALLLQCQNHVIVNVKVVPLRQNLRQR